MHSIPVEMVEHGPEVLRLASAALAETALWRPRGHSLEPLAAIVVGLVEVSLLSPTELRAHERAIEAAVRYGEDRYRDGLTDMFVLAELAALREGLHRYLEQCGSSRRTLRELLIRLDMAQTVAELAALRGFHREKIERAGLWDSLVVTLARESPLLNLPLPLPK